MARHVLAVPKGEWLLQSAAGSTLGRMLINLGRHDGFKTLNVVRRHEAIDELKKLGGDAVISSSDGPIDDQVREITGGAGARYAIDPVGGEAGTGVFRSLGPGGRLVLYGTLSGEPITVDPRLVISGPRSVEGFWLGHWMLQRSIPSALLLFREIAALIRQGVLRSEIGHVYPLSEIKDAAREAAIVGRQGKILLRLGEGR
jgi:NADPH:quinone reductase-like Zn-dependent oxidoreductase